MLIAHGFSKGGLTGRQCDRLRNNYLAGPWKFLAWRSSRLAVEGRDDQRIETGRTKRGLRSMTVSRGAEQALPYDRIRQCADFCAGVDSTHRRANILQQNGSLRPEPCRSADR
jgi:hypothetical protein